MAGFHHNAGGFMPEDHGPFPGPVNLVQLGMADPGGELFYDYLCGAGFRQYEVFNTQGLIEHLGQYHNAGGCSHFSSPFLNVSW
jgi:hypothetical protein